MGKIVSQISAGVSVSVETFYQPEYSNPANYEFMFAYRITIENYNSFPIKLLSRSWKIFDSSGNMRVVNGEGVVGEQPVISPDGEYQYVSGCNLRSEMGSMRGSYIFQNVQTRRQFEVHIPAFEMTAPFKLN